MPETDNPFADVLSRADGQTAPPPRRSRHRGPGTVTIAGHFPPAVHRQLRKAAGEIRAFSKCLRLSPRALARRRPDSPCAPGTAAPAPSPSPATFPRLSTANCACSASCRIALSSPCSARPSTNSSASMGSSPSRGSRPGPRKQRIGLGRTAICGSGRRHLDDLRQHGRGCADTAGHLRADSGGLGRDAVAGAGGDRGGSPQCAAAKQQRERS